jgi:hypothetical protein
MKINLVLLVGLLSFSSSGPALIAAEPAPAPSTTEAPADLSFDGYANVSSALYKDDLDAAKKAAAAAAKKETGAMATHYQGISESTTLDEARKHFKELNDIAIPIAKGKMTMHEMRCPMAFEGKGANWLQKSADEVQNPYMGSKMPHCGEAVK